MLCNLTFHIKLIQSYHPYSCDRLLSTIDSCLSVLLRQIKNTNFLLLIPHSPSVSSTVQSHSMFLQLHISPASNPNTVAKSQQHTFQEILVPFPRALSELSKRRASTDFTFHPFELFVKQIPRSPPRRAVNGLVKGKHNHQQRLHYSRPLSDPVYHTLINNFIGQTVPSVTSLHLI